MKDNETIDDFSGKLGAIVEKFKSLGSCLDEEMAVRKFLNSVPHKYLPIVASIEQYSDLETMSLEEALLLSNGEHDGRQYGRGFGRGERGCGRGSGRGDRSGFRCYKCGEFGHFAYECTNWRDKEKEANLIEEEEPALL
ncbi:hypothetical protein LXL04_014410 [Taraxacum kok-saghyz]